MKLALKTHNAADATTLQKAFSWLVKAKLVSKYSHSGIVIDGDLYHVTGAKGYEVVKAGNWSPEKWDILDVGGDDAKAKAEFFKASAQPKGRFRQAVWRLVKGYDWFSLLAFSGPAVTVSWLNYCFELSLRMMTGEKPTGRVTPERLLAETLWQRPDKV